MDIKEKVQYFKTVLPLLLLIPLLSQCHENEAEASLTQQTSFKFITAEDDGNTWLNASDEAKEHLCLNLAKVYIGETYKTELLDQMSGCNGSPSGAEIRKKLESLTCATFHVTLDEYYSKGSPGAKSQRIADVVATMAVVLHGKLQEGAPALVKYRRKD